MFTLALFCLICVCFSKSVEHKDNVDGVDLRQFKTLSEVFPHVLDGLVAERQVVHRISGASLEGRGGHHEELSEESLSHHFSSRATCNGVGVQAPTENICAANDCTITSFDCGNGTIVSASNFTGNYAQCSIASVVCTGSLGGPSNALIPQGCFVAQADCRNPFGALVPTEVFALPPTFSGCVLRSADCGSFFYRLFPQSSCANASLSCNGTLVTSQTSLVTSFSQDSCVRSSQPCPSSSCSDWIRICYNNTDPNGCTWYNRPCTDGCTIPNTSKNVCSCPLDWMPPSCTSRRPFRCNFVQISPTPQCEALPSSQPGVSVDYDPVCFRMLSTQQEAVVFSYVLQCSFTNSSGLSVPYPQNDGFLYAARVGTSTWAMSQAYFAQKNPLVARLKCFNWNAISNTSVAPNVTLTPAQLSGASEISFPLVFSQLDPRNYMVAGRLFAEVWFAPATSRSLTALSPYSQVTRLTVDFTDLADLSKYPAASRQHQQQHHDEEISMEFSNSSFPLGVVLLVCGIVVVMVVGYISSSSTKKQKAKRE